MQEGISEECLKRFISMRNKMKCKSIIEAINQLLAPPPVKKTKMGFQVKEKKVAYKKSKKIMF